MPFSRQRTLLQIPQGTEGFYLEEAYKHRQMVARIEQLFYSWGYLPAQTPVFDFFDIYRSIIPEELSRTIYRLIDRDGDLLMLRSDITLFLAKQIGLILRQDDLPLRVYYADTILRHRNEEDISKNEFFQIGIELIGRGGARADLEVLYLLERTLSTTGCSDWLTHIGSRAFFSAVTRNLPGSKVEAVEKAILTRQADLVEDLLGAGEGDPKRSRTLREILFFIGNRSEFRALLQRENVARLLSIDELAHLTYLLEIAEELRQVDAADRIRIDMSEIGTHVYYTGIVFQVYIDGIESAVASGGRYDTLLGKFGCDAPSVGFSILLRKLHDRSSVHETGQKPAAGQQVTEEAFRNAVSVSEKIRATGGIAII